MDLTREALEGYYWQRRPGPTGLPGMDADAACPYLATSPCAMAWHLGRHFAINDMPAPEPAAAIDAALRRSVMSGRGDTFSLRGRKDILLGRFQWKPDNTFREIAA